jgi:hypothetical protein
VIECREYVFTLDLGQRSDGLRRTAAGPVDAVCLQLALTAAITARSITFCNSRMFPGHG